MITTHEYKKHLSTPCIYLSIDSIFKIVDYHRNGQPILKFLCHRDALIENTLKNEDANGQPIVSKS